MRMLRTPSSVNSLYTPLGSIDSLPPPYFPRLSGESNPVFGEQKRLSTNWSASSALRLSTNWSARRTLLLCHDGFASTDVESLVGWLA